MCTVLCYFKNGMRFAECGCFLTQFAIRVTLALYFVYNSSIGCPQWMQMYFLFILSQLNERFATQFLLVFFSFNLWNTESNVVGTFLFTSCFFYMSLFVYTFFSSLSLYHWKEWQLRRTIQLTDTKCQMSNCLCVCVRACVSTCECMCVRCRTLQLYVRWWAPSKSMKKHIQFWTKNSIVCNIRSQCSSLVEFIYHKCLLLLSFHHSYHLSSPSLHRRIAIFLSYRNDSTKKETVTNEYFAFDLKETQEIKFTA